MKETPLRAEEYEEESMKLVRRPLNNLQDGQHVGRHHVGRHHMGRHHMGRQHVGRQHVGRHHVGRQGFPKKFAVFSVKSLE
jgi:hypothetical protein